MAFLLSGVQIIINYAKLHLSGKPKVISIDYYISTYFVFWKANENHVFFSYLKFHFSK